MGKNCTVRVISLSDFSKLKTTSKVKQQCLFCFGFLATIDRNTVKEYSRRYDKRAEKYGRRRKLSTRSIAYCNNFAIFE